MATATAQLNPAATWRPKVNPWLIAATVALAAFMEVLDTSIANVALPHISGSLGASPDEGTWVLTSYLVSNAVVLPLGGWASSVIGRKNFFMLCIVIFTVASFLCGIAPTLPFLLVCRVLQGAGGGGLQPMAQAIMADSFDPKDRGLAFSLYGIVAVLAPSIGPTLGGWITDNYTWHWIFYINIPVGILALFLVSRLVEDPPFLKVDRKNLFNLDYVGLGLLVLSMGAMQIMLDKGEENDWFSSNFIRFFGTLFVVAFITLIVYEWHAKAPLMNLKLFRFRNFAMACLLMCLIGGVLNAATVLQPQFLQGQMGYTATQAGMSLSLGGVALLFLMPLAGKAVGFFQARYLVAAGFSMFAVSFYYCATHLNLGMSLPFAAFLRVIQVAPIPFVFISVTTAAYVGLPREASNQVAGLINFVRNVGGSILIALTNAEVTQRSMFHQARLQESMDPSNPLMQQRLQSLGAFLNHAGGGPSGGAGAAMGQIYQDLVRQAATQGYIDVYFLVSVMSVVLIPTAFLLSSNRASAKTEVAVH